MTKKKEAGKILFCKKFPKSGGALITPTGPRAPRTSRSRHHHQTEPVDVDADCGVVVTMTLTTPHCPVAESMPGEVELRVGSVPGVRDAEVNLVWDPPWDPAKMSDEARLELGML